MPKEPDLLGSERTLNFPSLSAVSFIDLSVNEVRKIRSQKGGGGRSDIWKLSHTSGKGDHRSKVVTQLTVACSSFFREEQGQRETLG